MTMGRMVIPFYNIMDMGGVMEPRLVDVICCMVGSATKFRQNPA
jgi:hypothetical protein